MGVGLRNVFGIAEDISTVVHKIMLHGKIQFLCFLLPIFFNLKVKLSIFLIIAQSILISMCSMSLR